MVVASRRIAQLVFACALGGYAIVAACGGSDAGRGESFTSHPPDAATELPTGMSTTTTTTTTGGDPVSVGMVITRMLPTIHCTGSNPLPVEGGSASDAPAQDAEVPSDAEAGFEEVGPAVVADAGREASSDAGQCPLPPSICFDTNWLTYFTSGSCVDGLCQWNAEFMLCSFGCYSGGCGQLVVK